MASPHVEIVAGTRPGMAAQCADYIRGGESMSARKEWHPEKVRSGLTHPVIDADGHWIEYGPVFAEKVRKAAGDKAADGLLRHMRRIPDALSLSIAERRRRGIAMEGYWGRQSTNTRDRATAMMPRMLYDRLDELGIDFGIIYPTAGLGITRIDDDETRRAVIRDERRFNRRLKLWDSVDAA